MDGFTLTKEQLQEIIDTRTSEHVEESNREASGRSCHEIDDPTELLPLEMWMNVLEHLPPQDLLNMRNVHQRFCHLVDEKMTLIGTLQHGEKDIEPSLFSEFQLEIPFYRRELSEMRIDLRRDPSLKFQKYFIRSLTFSYRAEDLGVATELHEAFDEIIENSNDILERIGDQVLYFTCEFSAQMTRLPLFGNHYQTLSGWLSRMPNLKWFKFINLLTFPYDHGYPHSFGPLTELTPPELPNLERLDLKLSLGSKEASLICAKFLKAWPHVKILNVVGRRRKNFMAQPEPDFPILHYAFQLKEIKALEVLTVDGCSYRHGDMQLVKFIWEKNWKLKRLDLKLDMGNKSVFTCFKALRKLQCLEKLCLDMENVVIGENVFFIRLPHLTHFELKIKPNFEWNEASYPYFFSLQFMLFAKKLKVFVWKCIMNKSDWEILDQNLETAGGGGGGMIEFKGGRMDITESNIWSIFPWMEKINTEVVDVVEVEGTRTENSLKKEFCKGQLVLSEETSHTIRIRDIPDFSIEADQIAPAARPYLLSCQDNLNQVLC